MNNQDVILEGKKLFLSDLARVSGELKELQFALLVTQAPDGVLNLSSIGVPTSKLKEIQQILGY